MTPEQVVDVLTKCAAYDQRTVGEGDVMAWWEALSDLELSDALSAVTRHYRGSTDRMMPAHVRALVKDIRKERRALEPHEVRALPGRFEDDLSRQVRMERGMAQCRDVVQAIQRRLAEQREAS